jgi:hypothetical protein
VYFSKRGRNCPTSKSRLSLSSPFTKYFPFRALPKSLLQTAPSYPTEGRIAIVTNAGQDAMAAAALARNRDCRAACRERSRGAIDEQR